MLRAAIAIVALVTCVRAAQGEPVVRDADMVWGGSDAFCARTPRGLVCWSTWRAGMAPAVVALPQRASDVAVAVSSACALAGDAVWCFSMSDPGSPRKIPSDHPRQVLAVGGGWWTCVLDAVGVTCRGHDVTATPAAGHPRRIFASFEGGLCAVYDDRTTCYAAEPKVFGKPIGLAGVTDPSGVLIVLGGKDVYVVDGGVLQRGDRFDNARTMLLHPVPGIGRVKAMAAARVQAVVLDDKGVAAVFEDRIVERWPAATALWPQHDAIGFVTREADALHVHARDARVKWTDETPGLAAAPAQLISGRYATCVRDNGDITCTTKPPRF